MAAEFSKHPFLLSTDDVASQLETDVDKGLTKAQVDERHQKYPPNELDVGGAIPWYKILFRQLFNAMIIVSPRPPKGPPTLPLTTNPLQVLMFAMVVSMAFQDWIEGGVLAFVIVANVSIGTFQEYGAEKKMNALRALSAPSATVVRDGKSSVISK
jgi:P-type Na+/K+ transporter